MSREWDPVLATSANITLEQLRGFEEIFKKLDPDSENEINVTKFVRGGLGRATIQLHLTSRDLRKLFAALRQKSTGPGDPAHISLPVTPNEFLMAMAVPPFFRSDLTHQDKDFIYQFAEAVRQAAGFPAEPRSESLSTGQPAPAATIDSEPSGSTAGVFKGVLENTITTGLLPRKVQKTRLVAPDPEEDKYHKTLLQQMFDNTLHAETNMIQSAKPVDPKRVFSLMLFIVALVFLMVVYQHS